MSYALGSKQVDDSKIWRDQNVIAGLARLLATENLHVQFRHVSTALMDVKKRVLTLPIFADTLSTETVTMLAAHEVGHALFSPIPEESHFHDGTIKYGREFFRYINVAEDVRIEKLIQQKYRGLRKDFFAGYQELVAMGFFGEIIDITKLTLGDKVNLYYKAGPSFANFAFSDEERALVDEAGSTVTFDDVLAVSRKLFNYDKRRQEEQQAEMAAKAKEKANVNKPSEGDEGSEEGEGDSPQNVKQHDISEDDDEFDLAERDLESADAAESAAKNSLSDTPDAETKDSSGSDKSAEDSENKDIKSTGESRKKDEKKSEGSEKAEHSSELAKDAASGSSTGTDPSTGEFDGELSTDKNNEEVLEKLLGSFSSQNIKICGLDMVDAKSITIPWRKVLKDIHTSCDPVSTVLTSASIVRTWGKVFSENNISPDTTFEADLSIAKEVFNSAFKRKHSSYIHNMVREFELRKNAWQFARAREASTGTINITKAWAYKFNDDIFKKVTMIPGGKNHGMVLLIDLSISMSGKITAVCEQAFVVADFCRRVNIPCRVYGFTSSPAVSGSDVKVIKNKFTSGVDSTWEHNGNIVIWNFVDETMTASAFNEMRFWLCSSPQFYVNDSRVSRAFSKTFAFKYLSSVRIIRMSGTPLHEAILCTGQLIKQMRDAHQTMTNVSLMVLTDGDGNMLDGYTQNDYVLISPFTGKAYNVSARNTPCVADTISFGRTSLGNNIRTIQLLNQYHALLAMVKDYCNVTTIGFDLVGSMRTRKYLSKYNGYTSRLNFDLHMKEMKMDNYTSFDHAGFDQLFVLWDGVMGSDVMTGFDDDVAHYVPESKSVKVLAKSFYNFRNKVASSRVFLKQFVALIAA